MSIKMSRKEYGKKPAKCARCSVIKKYVIIPIEANSTIFIGKLRRFGWG
jgi:hypothetical protein